MTWSTMGTECTCGEDCTQRRRGEDCYGHYEHSWEISRGHQKWESWPWNCPGWPCRGLGHDHFPTVFCYVIRVWQLLKWLRIRKLGTAFPTKLVTWIVIPPPSPSLLPVAFHLAGLSHSHKHLATAKLLSVPFPLQGIARSVSLLLLGLAGSFLSFWFQLQGSLLGKILPDKLLWSSSPVTPYPHSLLSSLCLFLVCLFTY